MNILTAAQTANNIDRGFLQVNVTSAPTSFPLSNATVSISYTGMPGGTVEQLQTNSSGQTELLELAAPPLEYSLNPNNDIQPYAEYTIDKDTKCISSGGIYFGRD